MKIPYREFLQLLRSVRTLEYERDSLDMQNRIHVRRAMQIDRELKRIFEANKNPADSLNQAGSNF